MDGEEEATEEGTLVPTQLSWRLPLGALLEGAADVVAALSNTLLNLARCVLADHLYQQERRGMADQAHVEIEMLTEGD